MKLSEIVEKTTIGDWGNEIYSDEAPVSAHCIRSADIVPYYNNVFDGIPYRYVTIRSFNTRELKEGDIIIEKSGGTNDCSTGRVMYVSDELLSHNEYKLICSNFCASFRVKEGWCPKFVYYFLRLVHKRGIFHNYEGKTSGIHNLQMENAFKAIGLPSIEYSEQIKATNVLSTLDRKIALNRSINAELERMAKEIYDYWFVQFDFPDEHGRPYKSSGGKMVYNPVLKREIPAGWEVKNLDYFLSSISERTSRIGDLHANYTPIEVIPRKKMSFYETAPLEKAISGLCKYNRKDILLSNRRVYFHKVSIVPFNGVTRDTVIILRPNFKDSLGYSFQLVNSDHFIAFATKHSYGSEQPVLSWETAKKYKVCVPPMDIVFAYNKITSSCIDSILNNEIGSRQLSKLRDTLLPLLMTGQVGVK